MKELLHFLLTKIIKHPESIEIEEQIPGEGFMNLALKVNPEDAGIVIGKKGRTIRALKEILHVKGIQDKIRVNIDLKNTKED